MKNIFLFLAISVSVSMAAIHAGLQEAIDKNDIAKASAIIQNLGVKDVYCPATLSVANGKKLYGKRFSETPSLLYANCDEDFVRAYTKDVCSDKVNVALCKQVLNKTPIENWLPYLRTIHKNSLDKISEKYQEQVDVKGKRTKEQCELAMETEEKYKWTLEDAREFDSKNYAKFYNDLMKSCMKEPGVVGQKTVTKTRNVNPFLNYYVQFLSHVITQSTKLVGFTKENADAIIFVKTLDVAKSITEEYVNICTSSYRDSSYVSDKVILASCRFFSNFDKTLEKKVGFSMFSCKEALDRYSEKNLPTCNFKSENVVYMTKPIMDGSPSYAYSCNRGIWGPYTQQMKEAREAKKKAQESKSSTRMPRIEIVNLSIQTNPSGAAVTINGNMQKGKTPLTVKMKPGRYEILFSKDGYLVKDTAFTINNDLNNQTLKTTLTPVGVGSF